MKVVHYALGIAASIAMIVVMLITSIEIGAYSDFRWYEKEYIKYGVLEKLEMEMDDVMEVTREMMNYLRGDRDDLVIKTVVAGEEREFFNNREKTHMADVQHLFLTGMDWRIGTLVVFMFACIVLYVTKADCRSVLPKSFLIGTSIFTVGVGVLAVLVATDFNKYFLLFHRLIFENDLWILYPETDLLIRMLPEGFFFDMVIRIGVIFISALLLVLLISVVALVKQKHKKN